MRLMRVTLPVSKGTGWLKLDAPNNMPHIVVTAEVSQPVSPSSKTARSCSRLSKFVTEDTIHASTAP